MTVDPDLAAAVVAFDTYDADWVSGDPADLRRAYATARAQLSDDAARQCSVEAFAHGLIFTPSTLDTTDTAIVYFHGGSWCVGAPETHRVPCSHLAEMTGLRVFSIHYRLAPEHPFPAQREDGVATVTALFEDTACLFLTGDSAGAAVAFWTEHKLDEALRDRLAGIVGFYGGYGHALLNPPDEREDDGSGLSPAAILAAYARLGPLEALRHTDGFIIRNAARGDGPPCYIAAAKCDPLVDDSLVLAERLAAIGRPTTLDVAEGMLHSYLHYVARSRDAYSALERASEWILERK